MKKDRKLSPDAALNQSLSIQSIKSMLSENYTYKDLRHTS